MSRTGCWKREPSCGRGWSKGQGDPENDIEQAAGAGAEHGQQPDDADESGIEIEIVGHARTDAAQFFVAAGAHQALDWGNITASGRRGLASQLGATVVAELRAFSDFLLAFRAEHGSPPQSDVQSHSKQRYEMRGGKVSGE